MLQNWFPVIKKRKGIDFEDTDTQYMKDFKDSSYDFIYSSHTLEHMKNVEEALFNWVRLLKKDGNLILYIPDRDLYEKKLELPSKWNDDHKHFFTMYEQDEKSNATIAIIPFIKKKFKNLNLIYSKRCNFGWEPSGPEVYPKGEYSIELVYKKLF